ncbi:MAG: nucleotide sugar dehydrogenase [Phycisphaeraceae bacterium]
MTENTDQPLALHPPATVAVMALGYVGLPLALTLAEAGLKVIGFDLDASKVARLAEGRSTLRHIPETRVAEAIRSGRFTPTTDPDAIGLADAVLIAVPTPLGPHREPDLSHVIEAATTAAQRLRRGALVVLESTTYPGTTRDLVAPILTAHGYTPGSDCFIAYSPEREDPGRQDQTLRSVPKLVGGLDDEATRRATALYQTAFDQVVPVSSAEVAEAAKLLENIYRAVNIALVNEMKVVLSDIGVDIWEVIQAASTKPFGFQPFYPGPGLGGHCIPIDPFYMAWRAKAAGQPTRFIELAGEVNHAMPRYVVERTTLALNDAGLSVRDAKVLILGLAYKPDVDDVRESPSYELIRRLRQLGARITYHDPYLPEAPFANGLNLGLKSIDWSEQALADADAIVIACHHGWYDWSMIAQHARLIVDTRGVMRNQVNPSARIVQA